MELEAKARRELRNAKKRIKSLQEQLKREKARYRVAKQAQQNAEAQLRRKVQKLNEIIQRQISRIQWKVFRCIKGRWPIFRSVFSVEGISADAWAEIRSFRHVSDFPALAQKPGYRDKKMLVSCFAVDQLFGKGFCRRRITSGRQYDPNRRTCLWRVCATQKRPFIMLYSAETESLLLSFFSVPVALRTVDEMDAFNARIERNIIIDQVLKRQRWLQRESDVAEDLAVLAQEYRVRVQADNAANDNQNENQVLPGHNANNSLAPVTDVDQARAEMEFFVDTNLHALNNYGALFSM